MSGTELAQVAQFPTARAATLVIDHQSRAVQSLGEWAVSAQAAHEVAVRLVETSFVPVQFRGKPLEATAAILAGLEVGLQPMAALKSFDIIQGIAAPRAMTLRAIAQSFGHEIIMVESTETRCVMKGRRRDSTEWQTVRWTLDRAKNLGLTGKENWRKQPGTMLVARATSEIARLVASDAILGLGYASEELADGPIDVVPVVTEEPATSEPTSGRRTLSRRPLPAPATEPEPEPDTDAPTEIIGDPWELLVPHLSEVPTAALTVNALEASIRQLYRLMEAAEVWSTTDAGDALHRALKKHLQVEHLSGLKKAELVEFAAWSWGIAEKAVKERPL